MSHGGIELGRGIRYSLPCLFSDAIRTQDFDEFFRQYEGASFCVQTSDGWSWRSSPRAIPQFTATFQSRAALDAVIGDARETTLGRLFLDGAVKLEGNILILLSAAQYTHQHSEGLSPGLVQTVSRISHSFARRLIPAKRRAEKQSWNYAPSPLDLPASFFTPWLGNQLGHSCAFFRELGEDLESAQKSSFERTCEWLAIDESDRLLDVECGWGSYLFYVGTRYGICGHGITSNPEQMDVAAERVRCLGLEQTCSVGSSDLLLKTNLSGSFSKVSHLGIFEPVAYSNLSRYLARLNAIIAPGGMFLLHRMVRAGNVEPCITSLPTDFLSDSITSELRLAEAVGFEVLRFESLYNEYKETLRIWIDRLLNAPMLESTRLFSHAYRAWMLYLLELATCLAAGQTQIYRVLLRRIR